MDAGMAGMAGMDRSSWRSSRAWSLEPRRAHRGGHPFGPERMGPKAFGPFFAGGFGHGGFGPGGGGPFGRGRARRGDVRAAILALLSERPMHGYEMIQELDERTHGLWRPSPGSIYPTLQLLEDEGLVDHEDDNGKRSYRLTDAGREAVSGLADRAPWDAVTAGADPQSLNLRRSLGQLAAAAVQVMRAGSTAQQEEAERILAEARRRLYTLLASEE